MAHLMEQVDPDTICLMGKWRRDNVIHNFQTTDKSFMFGLSICMFQYVNYAFILLVHAGV